MPLTEGRERLISAYVGDDSDLGKRFKGLFDPEYLIFRSIDGEVDPHIHVALQFLERRIQGRVRNDDVGNDEKLDRHDKDRRKRNESVPHEPDEPVARDSFYIDPRTHSL